MRPRAADLACQRPHPFRVWGLWHSCIPALRAAAFAFAVLAAACAARGQERLSVDSVMARVYSYTARTGLKIEDFTSEIYARHYLWTRRRGFWQRYIPGMFRMERGTNSYFGESLARYQFSPSGRIDKKNIAAYSTMPYLSPTYDRWVGRYTLSIYESNLFTDRILSPLNRRNRRFYRYHYLYTYVSGGRPVVHIRVQPRISNTQLVEGTIDVEAATGRVCLFAFQFAYGWGRFAVSGEMGREGRMSLLPGKITLLSRLNVLGNRLEERFEATASYRFTPPAAPDTAVPRSARYDLTEESLLRTDTTRMRYDRAFFDSLRPYPLMPYEQEVYRRREVADSLSAAAPPAAPSRRFFSPHAEDILFDSHSLALGAQGSVELPPILTPSMVQWSGSKGISLQTRFVFNFRLARQGRLDFAPRVGYNFKQKQVYWRLPFYVTILPAYDGSIGFEAAGGDHMYSSRQADEVRRQLAGVSGYDSLVNVFDRYDFHYYRDNHFLFHFTLQPVVGLRVSAGMRFHRRSLIHWNEVAAQNGMDRTLTSLAPRFHVEWTPAQYYYRQNGRPVLLHSRWPTFMLDYERGIRAFNRDTYYERVEFDARYTLPLYALRSLYFRAGAGFYTRRGADCFLDYDYFRNNNLPEGWQDEMSGQFQLLDSRFYNESRYYARLSASYESPMLLFSRVRFLTRFVQKERIYCNLLSVRRLGFYSEWGYGLSTPFIDVAGFLALAGHRQTSVGCKVAFRLF